MVIWSVNFSRYHSPVFCHPETVEKTKELKKYLEEKNLDTYIEVDGGINKDTIDMVKEAEVDIAVAGSAIISASDFKQAIKELK